MKTIKIVSILTSSIIFILIALAINLEDPLKTNYRKVVEKIMESGLVDSEISMLEKYPALKEAKENIAKADMLKTQICTKTSGTTPALTKTEEAELESMQKQLLETRQYADRLLKNLLSAEDIAGTP